jgi:hypothetical protein
MIKYKASKQWQEAEWSPYSGYCLLFGCLLARFTLLPWWWRQFLPPKHLWTSTRLYGVTYPKAVFFEYNGDISSWNFSFPRMSARMADKLMVRHVEVLKYFFFSTIFRKIEWRPARCWNLIEFLCRLCILEQNIWNLSSPHVTILSRVRWQVIAILTCSV